MNSSGAAPLLRCDGLIIILSNQGTPRGQVLAVGTEQNKGVAAVLWKLLLPLPLVLVMLDCILWHVALVTTLLSAH